MKNDITFMTNPNELESMEDHVFFLLKLISSPVLDIRFDEARNRPVYSLGYAKVDQINGLTLIIHPDEDPPPHFHITSANISAK